MPAENIYAFEQILNSLERRGAIMKVADDGSKIEAKFLNDSVATIAWYAIGRKYGGDSKDVAGNFKQFGVKPIRSDDELTLTFIFRTKA